MKTVTLEIRSPKEAMAEFAQAWKTKSARSLRVLALRHLSSYGKFLPGSAGSF